MTPRFMIATLAYWGVEICGLPGTRDGDAEERDGRLGVDGETVGRARHRDPAEADALGILGGAG